MKIFTESFPPIGGPFAVCIGKFDGLHVGHRLVLDTLLEEAARHSAQSAVYSFEPRNGAPRLLALEEKTELFASLGIDILINAELSEDFMATPAEVFVRRLASSGELKAVAVGRDFRFGRGAVGDVELLRALGEKLGFEVHAIPQGMSGGQPVSSTMIREAVKAGDLERASVLLGREYSLSGEVVHGMRLAQKLGFRTANIEPPRGKLLPAFGVYAAWVHTNTGIFPAMVNIGVKPTVNGREPLIESHLIGFEGNLYGQRISVRLEKRIRDEIKFENLRQLSDQMEKDLLAVQELMPRNGEPQLEISG